MEKTSSNSKIKSMPSTFLLSSQALNRSCFGHLARFKRQNMTLTLLQRDGENSIVEIILPNRTSHNKLYILLSRPWFLMDLLTNNASFRCALYGCILGKSCNKLFNGCTPHPYIHLTILLFCKKRRSACITLHKSEMDAKTILGRCNLASNSLITSTTFFLEIRH